jgi:hypothetical protein
MSLKKSSLCLFTLSLVAAVWWFAAERRSPGRGPTRKAGPNIPLRAESPDGRRAAADAQAAQAATDAPAVAQPAASAREPESSRASAAPTADAAATATPSPQVELPAAVARKLKEKAEAQSGPQRYDEPEGAAEYYRLKRLPPGERDVPVEKYLAAQEHIRRMPRYSTALERALPPLSEARSEAAPEGVLPTWEPLGPGNVGGRTRALLIHPQNPQVMYAAGVSGGVWKTTNGGASWTPLADLIANIAVNSLAMDPANSNVIYAGTGEGVTMDFRGAGIFKTTDGGTSWSQFSSTNTSDFHYVNDLVISPHDSRRVYAATQTGVWRSTDGGATWSRALGANVTGGCLDLVIRTDKPTDYVFASCGNLTQATVYRNTDAGGAGVWESVHTENGMGRTSLSLAPSNQDVIYAASASYLSGNYRHGLHAVFRSISSGDAGTWAAQVRNTDAVKLNTMLFTNPLAAFGGECGFGPSVFASQGWYDNVVAVDPADANRVWVGGIDLFRSDDGGRTWGQASHWWAKGAPQYAHADSHVIAFHPQYDGLSNQRMFVGGDGGVFRTDNARGVVNTSLSAPCNPAGGAVAWTSLNNGYGVTQFYHGAVFPDGRSYLGGTQDNGTQFGTDAAGVNGWREVLGGDGGYVAVDPTNPNVIYAEHTRLSLRKSVDGGRTFQSAVTGITESRNNFLFIAPFAMDPSDAQRLWIGGYGLWRTEDGAATWQAANSGSLPQITSIAVAPTDSNTVICGTLGGGVYRSDQALGAATYWEQVGYLSGFISSLAFDPADKNVTYATTSSFGVPHVWRRAGGGAPWARIDGTGANRLPDIPAHCVVVDPENTQRLYVGTDLGVFVTTDGGANWAVENTGFANVVVESLSIVTANGENWLYAFSHGRGVWRVRLGESGCRFTLSPPKVNFESGGGTGAVTLTPSRAGCGWNAAANADWISLNGGDVGGPSLRLGYSVAPNRSLSPRAGTVTVGGRSFTVTQAAGVDSTPPTIRITSPSATGMHQTDAGNISLSGTVGDDLGLARVTWESDRGYRGDATLGANGRWDVTQALLPSGVNRFTVTAQDAAGNTASASLTVINRGRYVIVTVAGDGAAAPSDGSPAANVRLSSPYGLFVDRGGTIYFLDGTNRARKITPDGRIFTVAGSGSSGFSGDGGPATSASFTQPRCIVADSAGNVYIGDTRNFRLRRVRPDGIIETIGGTGVEAPPNAPNSVIGQHVPAMQAMLGPVDMDIDDAGNLYFTDNWRVRKVTATDRIISTVVGTGRNDDAGEGGPAVNASLINPANLAADGAGVIYTGEQRRLRRTGADGIIRTIAGNGTFGSPTPDVPATSVPVMVDSVACDRAGNVVLFDYSRRMWTIDSAGILRLLAGGGSSLGPSNGVSAIAVSLVSLSSFAVDAAGTVYFSAGDRIYKIVPAGDDLESPRLAVTAPASSASLTVASQFLSLAGTASDNIAVTQVGWRNERGGAGVAVGPPEAWAIHNLQLQPGLNSITVTAWDGRGNAASTTLAVTYNAPAVLTTFAGSRTNFGFRGEGDAAGAAHLFRPESLTFDAAGNLYIADTGNHRVRKVTPAGVITTFAGGGRIGYGGDGGPATAAELNEPQAVAVDSSGNVYISDTNNHRVRKVTPAGIISTFAGAGVAGFGGDGGPAAAALLDTPGGLAVDGANNLLIADAGNHRVRRINLATGVITTVAGSGYGFGGDSGRAADAKLYFPTGVAADGMGNLYIADTGNNRVRKVTPPGFISTAAGTGNSLDLGAPGGLTVDGAGNLYIAEQGRHRIRKLTPGGVFTTVAGTGAAGAGGEGGAATDAQLNQPAGVAVDRAGNLFVADTFNHRVVVMAAYNSATTASGATYLGGTVAQESIVSVFGARLAANLPGGFAVPGGIW